MRRWVALFAIAVSMTSGMSASADGGTFNGGGRDSQPLTRSEIQKNDFKSSFAVKYLAHLKSGGTAANFPGGLKSLERLLNDGQPFDTAATQGEVTPLAYPASNLSKSLFPQYQAQETPYFCGPASAWVALKWLSAGNSYSGNLTLNQTNLGSSSWLNTNNPNGTGRGSNWTHTLNSWKDGTDSGWYIVANFGASASATDVASKFATDIDLDYVPVMNVYMTPSRGLLPGWQSYTEVWHYVPGRGYSQYGDYLDYIEVFQPVGLGPKYNITKEFFAAIVSSYGMIW
jgi:hypothetical protein